MAQDQGPEVSWAVSITTRDGTLTKDSKMVNCFVEMTDLGPAAVKRPGLTLVQALASGVPQGQFICGTTTFAIVGDVIYNTQTGEQLQAIPGVTVPNQQYNILSNVPAGETVFKSASGIWWMVSAGFVVTKVTDANYPTTTVPGLSYLDGVYYVMDSAGAVHGSALEDITTWPALNFIQADATLGVGAGIVRHLNYIVAFYTAGTQFYYDAGVSPGIALQAVGNASWTTGCGQGDSIVELTDLTFFIGKNLQYGRTVQQFNGLSIVQISDPFVEKVLNRSQLTTVFSFGIKTAGHSFYVLTLADIDVTLVFDLVLNRWHLWSSLVSGEETFFQGVNYLASPTQDLIQDLNTGQVLAIDPTAGSDNGSVINTRIVTSNHDWGMLKRKRFSACYQIADTQNTTVQIHYTDDDYQTYSTFRTVDMSTVRKMLQRCGSSRRRAWELLHTDNTPLRLYEMTLDMTVGPS